MSGMSDREKAFENKYAHDEELKFKVEARRNKLLGLWAAELLGRDGDAANEYASEVIRSDFQEAGDEDVFRKVKGDLDAAQVEMSDHRLRRTMDELLEEAKTQIMGEQS